MKSIPKAVAGQLEMLRRSRETRQGELEYYRQQLERMKDRIEQDEKDLAELDEAIKWLEEQSKPLEEPKPEEPKSEESRRIDYQGKPEERRRVNWQGKPFDRRTGAGRRCRDVPFNGIDRREYERAGCVGRRVTLNLRRKDDTL